MVRVHHGLGTLDAPSVADVHFVALTGVVEFRVWRDY